MLSNKPIVKNMAHGDTAGIYMSDKDGINIRLNEPLVKRVPWSYYYISFFNCILAFPDIPCVLPNKVSGVNDGKVVLAKQGSENGYMVTRQSHDIKCVDSTYKPFIYGKLLTPIENEKNEPNHLVFSYYCFNEASKLYMLVKEELTTLYKYTIIAKSTYRNPIYSRNFINSFKTLEPTFRD